MPACSMRPNEIALPPGVQARRPATAKLAASSSAMLSTMRERAARQGRRTARCRVGRAPPQVPRAAARAAPPGRGVGRGRKRDQHDQRPALPARQRLGAQHHEIEREHRKAGEDVGQQRAHEPGQGGDERQRRDGDDQHARPSPARARAASATAPRPSAAPAPPPPARNPAAPRARDRGRRRSSGFPRDGPRTSARDSRRCRIAAAGSPFHSAGASSMSTAATAAVKRKLHARTLWRSPD